MKTIPYGEIGWYSIFECIPETAKNVTENQTQFMILKTENGEVIPGYWSKQPHKVKQSLNAKMQHGFIGYNNYGIGYIVKWQYPPQ
jgi:hypothetical protein